MKKEVIVLCIAVIVLSSFALATKIEISTTNERNESFVAGENITLKVSLYDDNNNPIDTQVNLIIEDAEKITRIEQVISSNKFTDIDLGENARNGYWKITARYEDENNQIAEGNLLFNVEMKEQAKFEIQGDKLAIINTGNTRYTKTIQIIIGDSLGTKKLDLEIGEKISFRLIAPDGVYGIKVAVDGKTQLEKSGVALTGKVIGILDENLASGETPVTGGIKPGEGSEEFYSTTKNRNYIYVFLLVVIGAAILLALERSYKKKI